MSVSVYLIITYYLISFSTCGFLHRCEQNQLQNELYSNLTDNISSKALVY